MTKKLGVVMDPISKIKYHKDSTLAMLWEAQKRNYKIFYFEQTDLFLEQGGAFGYAKPLEVAQNEQHWFNLGASKKMALADLDIILMRKDPPVDKEYFYTTYILEQAERDGVFVANKPQSLRDVNEKLFTLSFPQCCPPSLVTCNKNQFTEFLHTHKKIVCKPLNGMGGKNVFCIQENDPNANTIFNLLTENEMHLIMVQKFIPEITQGDKRILLINGEPIPFALARIPGKDDWHGNLALGAKGVAQPLSQRDSWICQEVGPTLRAKGLYFVGLDVIGDYLTEINVTSPTCIRELDAQCHLNISAQLFDIF